MAGTTTKSRRTQLAGNDVNDLLIQFNKLVDDLETLRAAYAATLAKLDADAGVTDTNYVSLNTVLAAGLTAAKIGNQAGTAVTATAG